MKKKAYVAPVVRKVRLVVKNAILGNCHSSPDLTPRVGDQTCTLVPQDCWYGP
jgi:hypothetical protein